MTNRTATTVSLLLLACLAAGCYELTSNGVSRTDQGLNPAARAPLVVVDPGHGGSDPGAMRLKIEEKILNLEMAKYLAEILRAEGIEVILTREDDTFVELQKRIARANQVEATAFVSVHTNTHPLASVSGVEVYTPPETDLPGNALTYGLIGLPRYDIFNIYNFPDQDLIHAINAHRKLILDSEKLSADICRAMGEDLRTECREKHARFVVLREAEVPAVLVEVGYLSNDADRRRLLTEQYKRAAAESIARGVMHFLKTSRRWRH